MPPLGLATDLSKEVYQQLVSRSLNAVLSSEEQLVQHHLLDMLHLLNRGERCQPMFELLVSVAEIVCDRMTRDFARSVDLQLKEALARLVSTPELEIEKKRRGRPRTKRRERHLVSLSFNEDGLLVAEVEEVERNLLKRERKQAG